MRLLSRHHAIFIAVACLIKEKRRKDFPSGMWSLRTVRVATNLKAAAEDRQQDSKDSNHMKHGCSHSPPPATPSHLQTAKHTLDLPFRAVTHNKSHRICTVSLPHSWYSTSKLLERAHIRYIRCPQTTAYCLTTRAPQTRGGARPER